MTNSLYFGPLWVKFKPLQDLTSRATVNAFEEEDRAVCSLQSCTFPAPHSAVSHGYCRYLPKC